MPQNEKTEEVVKKKRSKKTAKRGITKEKEEKPSAQQLDRDRLETLRERLQRKYH